MKKSNPAHAANSKNAPADTPVAYPSWRPAQKWSPLLNPIEPKVTLGLPDVPFLVFPDPLCTAELVTMGYYENEWYLIPDVHLANALWKEGVYVRVTILHFAITEKGSIAVIPVEFPFDEETPNWSTSLRRILEAARGQWYRAGTDKNLTVCQGTPVSVGDITPAWPQVLDLDTVLDQAFQFRVLDASIFEQVRLQNEQVRLKNEQANSKT